LPSIIADVLTAAVRILGDVTPGGEVRRIVETGGGNRYRQAVERSARGIERGAEHADVLARRRRHNTRFDRGGERLHPGGADLVERAVKAEAVDFRIGGNVVGPAH